MRTISAPSLAKLATRFGTEPINILTVQWVEGGGFSQYADRDITGGIKGKIQTIGELDAVINVSGNSQSQSIDVTLDDTDGSIKAILDTHDIHKRPCKLYQWFDGLATGEKFLVFQGQVSSPITWNEGDRTVSFTIISKLEDRQVGFSAEEGAFAQIPEKLVGAAWPMIFGRVLHVPALTVTEPLIGTITKGVAIHDFTLPMQRDVLATQRSYANIIALIFNGQKLNATAHEDTSGAADFAQRESEALSRMAELATQSAELKTELDKQVAEEKPTVTVVGGEKFPQNTSLKLDINGGIFTGSFSGQTFTITAREHPQFATKTDKPHVAITLSVRYPMDGPRELLGYTERVTGSNVTFFWAECGSRVKMAQNEPIDYIVSIVPGTILNVSAKRAFEGVKRIITVPPSYYSVRTQTFGSVSAMMVRLNKPLSSYTDEGWEDDLYVSFQSTIGPNTVDILQYLIQVYTPELGIDAASFNHVRSRLAEYPSNFALLEQKNIVQVLEEIARQARCAIWLNGDVFSLRYLPEEPTPSITISQSDIVPKSMEVFHTNTEDLVTKLTAEWREHYAVDKPNKVILKHNVAKYGTHEKTEDYYIYNQQDYVIKSATFWLIREANTWKKLRFSTFIHKLQLEALDPVTLNFSQPYISSGPVIGIIEKANFDSSSNEIKFEIWTPIKAGTMTAYNFAWPADVDQNLIFPTVQEEAAGNAGGDNPFKNADGDLSGGTIVTISGYRTHQDYGDKHPSDQGDHALPPPALPDRNNFDQTKPTHVTPVYQKNDYTPGSSAAGLSMIDLHTTVITDSTTKESTKLDTFFKRVKDKKLEMDTNAVLNDGDNQGTFDFRWDGVNSPNKFAAGRAYLLE
ncbi:MAG: hypothetical protein ACYC35_00635 [Pirellulales bacterium]